MASFVVEDPQLFIAAVTAACQALIAAEPEITKYDTIAGDGDCGETLKAGATGVMELVQNEEIQGLNIVRDLLQISEVVNQKMGGTSGGLYRLVQSKVPASRKRDMTSLMVSSYHVLQLLQHLLQRVGSW